MSADCLTTDQAHDQEWVARVSQSRRIPLDEFGNLFTIFSESAFRLESRDSYYEQDELNIWLKDGPAGLPDGMWQGWYDLMQEHAAAGRSVRRVRVVSEPHTDYTRFGLWIGGRNVRAGEEIRYLERGRAEALGIPPVDYWIFDSNRVDYVLFDDDSAGELLGAEEVTDPAEVARAQKWLDEAWEIATPRDEYAARWRERDGLPEDS